MMSGMISAEVAGARLAAALGPCRHRNVEPVDLIVTGETVALICADCWIQLPLGFTGEVVEIRTLGHAAPVAYIPTV